MNNELQQKLYDKYPKIFRQKDLPMTETCMCWGISVGDGWYNIIDVLCARIQSHCDWLQKKGDDFQVEAVQVKEKFGELRFYTNYEDEYISGLISMADGMSARTCEDCGKPGKMRGGGWIRCLCDECAAPRGKK